MRRWATEVDYLYLKSRLRLEDFRLRSIEGITKYFTLTFLTLAYLSWRETEEQYEEMLWVFGRKALETQSVEVRSLFSKNH